MRRGFSTAGMILLAAWASTASGADKSGVSPQVISLPSGPGSIQGLGESFQPQLNTGSGTFAIAIKVPPGPAGHAPRLAIQYNTGTGNGPLGIGWMLAVPSIVRSLDGGVPRYVDGPNGFDDDGDGTVDNPEEIDRFSGVDSEELVPLIDGYWRAENEEGFYRYQRVGAGWEARARNGVLHEFGKDAAARIEDGGRVFRWLLQRVTDLNGNVIEYSYAVDPNSPGQKYLRQVRWGQQDAFFATVFSNGDSRPDVYSDYRSGFDVRTALRLARIDVISQGLPAAPSALSGDINADGTPDALIRRYVIEYEPTAQVSLIERISQYGDDGATALPATTFEYTSWAPPDNVAASVIMSFGEPPLALNSDSVELVDMNADGLPDILSTVSSQHRVYANRGLNAQGKLAWDTSGVPVGNAPLVDIASPSIHLADVNADGLADLAQKVTSTSFRFFANTGASAWSSTPVSVLNTDTWPIWPFDGSTGAASRTIDIDHNRFSDILYTGTSGYRLWMLLPNGRYAKEVRPAALSDGSQVFRFDLPGTHIADLNGDRLSDLAWIQSSRVVYWPSRGEGDFGGPIILPLDMSLSSTDIGRAGFADVNGDGLADLTIVRPTMAPQGMYYWLNRGLAGLDARRTMNGLPAMTGGDVLRWADMNGNGSTDIVIANSSRPAGYREQFIDLIPGVRPHLLSRIRNGLGLEVVMHYQTTIDQMLAARDAGMLWSSTMPISVPVVAKITENDGRGNTFVRELTYRDPYYNPAKQEFRGFAQAEVREVGDTSAPTKITRHWFDTGRSADCLKGKLVKQDATDAAGHVFARTENAWSHRSIATSPAGLEVRLPFNQATDTYVFESTPNAVRLRTEYGYDDYGNVTVEDSYGVTDGSNHALGNDETLIRSAFILDVEKWIVDRRWRQQTRDLSGVLQAESRYYYDDLPFGQLAKGNLTRNEGWLATEARYIPVQRSEYDSFGNVVTLIDANGHMRTIQYDPLLYTFPVAETIHLEGRVLTTAAEYDFGLGSVTAATDFAGAKTLYTYDVFGRLAGILRPGGAEDTYVYDLGNPLSRIVKRVRENFGGGTFDVFTYFDGFGRKLGVKAEAEDGQWRFLGAVEFNARKLERRRWLPYFTATSEYTVPNPAQPYSTVTYDVRDRVTQSTNPDSTFSSTVYQPLIQHAWDENDNAGSATPMTYRYDGRNRLVEVTERNGPESYVTRYTWSTLGDLTQIVDAHNNVKAFTHDTLRRKIGMNDPDRGIMVYVYDDAGNLIRTTDAKGQVIEYGYDFANRLLTENYLDAGGGPEDPVDVSYTYDLPSLDVSFGDGVTTATAEYTGGRLASVRDLSGEEHFSYDVRGNTAWTVKRIRDPMLEILASFATGFSYDTMDRITDIIYPDNDHVRHTYNTSSFTERIDGGVAGQVIISNIDYEPSGQPGTIHYGNGVVTTYGYDNRNRLNTLATNSPVAGPLIDYSYLYDDASNILKITDRRPAAAVPLDSPRRNTQVFGYDDLYRLTQVKYAPVSDDQPTLGQIDYAYDAIGNMLSQTTPPPGQPGHIEDQQVSLGAMAIGSPDGSGNRVGRNPGDPPGPHALTATAVGGTYEYDDNGNMIGIEGASCRWDFKDRLTRHQKGTTDTRYIYDYSGRRIAKLVAIDGRTDQTLYVNRFFEIRPNQAPVKYVFNGDMRTAQVKGTLDSSRPRVQRTWLWPGWNLISIAVHAAQEVSEIFGGDGIAFIWDGKTYTRLASSAIGPYGQPIWVWIPTSRLAVALGNYDAQVQDISIPPGATLQAWPRLEPFVPQLHLTGGAHRLATFDSASADWRIDDRYLPSFLRISSLNADASAALWIFAAQPTTISAGKTKAQDTLFYHLDHLASGNAMTDADGALITDTAHYPFGLLRSVFHTSASAPSFQYGFSGKELDGESGLYCFGARFLIPHAGRFATVDPRSSMPGNRGAGGGGLLELNPQGANPYGFALSNPVRFNDPSGLAPYDVVVSGGTVSGMTPQNGTGSKDGFALNIDDAGKSSAWESIRTPVGPYKPRITSAMAYYWSVDRLSSEIAEKGLQKWELKSDLQKLVEATVLSVAEDFATPTGWATEVALDYLEAPGFMANFLEGFRDVQMGRAEKYQDLKSQARSLLLNEGSPEGAFLAKEYAIGKKEVESFGQQVYGGKQYYSKPSDPVWP